VTVTDRDLLARPFETRRNHLRGVALRVLGSSHEAHDAVQEAWLKPSPTDADAVGNLGRWLTTPVYRVCLDVLRARAWRPPNRLEARDP
jgi:RNA polymerase sigma-70 factor (ECF subfamily)